ncbi:maleylacetate reductase [Microvirga vignae]|uniref:maleylacetate reductase n=1 Tax=Microvirga vignae TaxID=1225564 RepID=UPI001237738B|nr:maleylacetate reductase [Microvirga vignae]
MNGRAGIGMPADGTKQAVRAAMAAPYWNPRPLEEQPSRELLTRAWNGDPPRA